MAAYTRNIAVIAHVDHGKTTLSDSFLSRANLLSEDKAGSALSMDFNKEEIERGITINSSGITLCYDDWEFLGAVSEPEELDPDRSSAIYVGNLAFIEEHETPAEYEEATLSLFSRFGVIKEFDVHSKRGFARITFESQSSCDDAIASMTAKPIFHRGRSLRVERAGEGPIQVLTALCMSNNLPSPSFSDFLEGVVSVSIGETVFESKPCTTIKEAKLEACRKAIRHLSGQPTTPTPVSHRGLTVNLIDCPGHVDFNAEVSTALRLTDGAVVVVDAVEGVCIQTEVVLRQALQERVKVILLLNKVDRVLSELQLTAEAAFLRFSQTIDSVNAIIETYQPPGVQWTVHPEKGDVAFGSGLHGWAFNLPRIAELLVEKQVGSSKSTQEKQPLIAKLSQRLWTEFYHPVEKRFSKSGGEGYVRAFCHFAFQPISDMFEMVRLSHTQELLQIASKLPGVKLSKTEIETGGKVLLKSCLKQWIPVADQLLRMIEVHLPSPKLAQTYRSQDLYDGPEDQYLQAMRNCDESGPTIVYVSKMLPPTTKGSKSMIAFGRVFSGKLVPGQNIFVCGPNYKPGARDDLCEARIGGLVTIMASKLKTIDSAQAGSIVGILGLDKYVTKSCTLTSDVAAFPLKVMKLSVSPIVRVALSASNPTETSKLHDALKRLIKSDPLAQYLVDPQTNELLLCGAGELHVEVCLNRVREMASIEIKSSPPVVQFCETVTESGPICLSKSSNKHNRLFVRASPLSLELCSELEGNTISMSTDSNSRVAALSEKHGWSRDRARKIMSISGTCILLDSTVGVALGDIRDNVIASFNELAETGGPLSSETLRGILFEVVDAKMHSDSAHRKSDQICPMSRRAMMAAILTASPRYVEPIYKVDIQAPDGCVGAVCRSLKKRRGEIVEDVMFEGTPLHALRVFLPVQSSFGFSAELLAETSGRAFAQCSFSHWMTVGEDPLSVGTRANAIVQESRKRKGMALTVPPLDYYQDRL